MSERRVARALFPWELRMAEFVGGPRDGEVLEVPIDGHTVVCFGKGSRVCMTFDDAWSPPGGVTVDRYIETDAGIFVHQPSPDPEE